MGQHACPLQGTPYNFVGLPFASTHSYSWVDRHCETSCSRPLDGSRMAPQNFAVVAKLGFCSKCSQNFSGCSFVHARKFLHVEVNRLSGGSFLIMKMLVACKANFCLCLCLQRKTLCWHAHKDHSILHWHATPSIYIRFVLRKNSCLSLGFWLCADWCWYMDSDSIWRLCHPVLNCALCNRIQGYDCCWSPHCINFIPWLLWSLEGKQMHACDCKYHSPLLSN